jgi:hypothetical protein
MPSTTPRNLTGVLDAIEAAEGARRVKLAAVLDAVGRRAFGPLLVVAALVGLAPGLGDVPGIPTSVALFTITVTAQIVAGRRSLWLPKWLLARSVSRGKLAKAVTFLRKPAGWLDRILRPRLRFLVAGGASRIIAGISLGFAIVMPMTEIVPFSANLAGLILLSFGMAVIAEDGVMALVGTTATVAAITLLARTLL